MHKHTVQDLTSTVLVTHAQTHRAGPHTCMYCNTSQDLTYMCPCNTQTHLAGPHVYSCNGAPHPSLSSLPALAPTTKIQDNMLALLLHMMSTTGQHATLLCVPGT